MAAKSIVLLKNDEGVSQAGGAPLAPDVAAAQGQGGGAQAAVRTLPLRLEQLRGITVRA